MKKFPLVLELFSRTCFEIQIHEFENLSYAALLHRVERDPRSRPESRGIWTSRRDQGFVFRKRDQTSGYCVLLLFEYKEEFIETVKYR